MVIYEYCFLSKIVPSSPMLIRTCDDTSQAKRGAASRHHLAPPTPCVFYQNFLFKVTCSVLATQKAHFKSTQALG
jgi:hypothetical protein